MSIGKKKFVFVMGGLCFLITILIVALVCFYNSNNNAILEKTIEEKSIVDKKQFAMYINKDDGNGYVEYTESDYFPENYYLNLTESYCTDSKDQLVDNVISYVNNKVAVTSNKTLYCHLYFDKTAPSLCTAGDTLGNCLIDNNSSINELNDNIEGGLYRYQGTTADNYVCFGTSDINTCTENPYEYMYRIIGVDSSGQVKLIKYTALNSLMQWYSNDTSDITWPNSAIYSNINGSAFLTNTTYVPSGWSNSIATVSWKYGDTEQQYSADEIYAIENAFANTVTAKIGLMYAHDYYYAYQSGGLNCSNVGNYELCRESWLYYFKDWDLTNYTYYETTMTRLGLSSGNIWNLLVITAQPEPMGEGRVAGNTPNESFYIRPVFYLNSNVLVTSGTGAINNPFIIEKLLDTEPPTVTASLSGSSISITSSEDGTYCVNTSSTRTDFSNCVKTGNISTNITILESGITTSGTYYVHVKDSAGNIGISSAVSLTISQSVLLYDKIYSLSPTGLVKSYALTNDTLYRFTSTSTSVNNYICLGATSCTTTSANMYRIIGIEPSTKYIKVIKATKSDSYTWGSSASWTSSTLFSSLKTYYESLSFKDIIVSHSWGIGNANGYTSKSALLTSELASTTTAYVGALSVSDYYLAYTTDQNWYSSYNTNNWIGLYNSGESGTEWTMSIIGSKVWYIASSGYIKDYAPSYSLAARPVFYLNSTVNYKSGSGTSGDPFIIE